MCHATKQIKCDMQDDEYFENHYQFSQGYLHPGDVKRSNDVVETLLYSKCQKDPLSTDAEYKHRRVLLTKGGEYCARCKTKTPLSLKILSCNVILKRKEITMVGVSFLPRELIKLLMEVGLSNIKKNGHWNAVKNSIIVLLEYWPYKVLDLTTLSDKGWLQIALTRLVLDRFAAEINSDALQKPCRNQLTEFVMKTSVEPVVEASFYFKLLCKFASTVCDEKRRCVFEHAKPRRKYIITTAMHIHTEQAVRRTLYLLRLSRKPGSPIEVRIVSWHVYVANISTLAEIFQEINPEIVKSFSMIIKSEDILKLDEILKPCVELTSLSLELCRAEGNDGLGQKLANDLSLLIGHHPTLKRLVLDNFQHLLVGYWDKYRLPTSLETLVLYNSILMHVDLEHGTDVSTTSHIRYLMISSFSNPSDVVEGFLKFVESHAETLVSLHIDLSWDEHQPTVDSLKRMAKRLAQFNKLQRFTYHVQNVYDILVILRNVMPLIAVNQSFNSYELTSHSGVWKYKRDFLQALQLAVKKICIGRRRLLDFATVYFNVAEEFVDGMPTLEYREVFEVIGDQRNSPYDSDCQYHVYDNFDFEDGIRYD